MRFWKKKVRTPADRVRMIEHMVDVSAHGEQGLRLRQLVIQEMLQGVEDRNDSGQVRAIYEWVRSNIRYIEDPVALDLYPSALVLEALGGGDCDDHVVFLCAALAVIGFTVGCRVIQTVEGDWHIYSLVWMPKAQALSPIPLDTTWPDASGPGDEYPRGELKYSKSWVFDFK